MAETGSNHQSSRSHCVIRIYLDYRTEVDGQAIRRRPTLSLVDLAGSESLKKAATTGKTRIQTAKINCSLMILGKVVSQVA